MSDDLPPTPAPPEGLVPLREEDVTEQWPGLRRRLAQLLTEPEPRQFLPRLAGVADHVRLLARAQPEDSLFVLVQMLTSREYGYSATHALTSAFLCALLAPQAGLNDAEDRALVLAALTMNIGMTTLHDELSRQAQPLYEEQRLLIKAHPAQGVARLQALGVTDALWLALVQDHHESPDGTGYPAGKTDLHPAQQLLRMADLFIAKISPRATRRGLSPRLAVGSIYLEAQSRHNTLGALFARQLGMYPPGSYVRLRNHELAVVVRRGDKVTTPKVMAIVGIDGLPLSVPEPRDTARPDWAVVGTVPPEDVHLRLDAAKLLKRI